MRQPRVVLADDHRQTAALLRKLLEPHFDVVELVEDGRALVSAAVRLSPDVTVADTSVPIVGGIDALCVSVDATQRLGLSS